jgi:hypothetical protein
VLVTGPGPYYAPLAEFDFEAARRNVEAHLLLPLRVARDAASKVRPGGTLLFDGRRHLRPPILKPGAAHPGDVVGRYQAALDAGDTEAVVSTFTPDGFFREAIGPPFAHRGASELRSFFSMCFSAGGGIGFEPAA